jgi:hypothetical protein
MKMKLITGKLVLQTLFAIALVSLLSAAFVCHLQAQTTTPDPSVASGFLQGLVDAVSGKYGWVVTLVTVIGSLRVLLKPIMTVVEGVVANDPKKAEALANFEHGTIFKWISFGLDLGASIKLPAVKAAVTTSS